MNIPWLRDRDYLGRECRENIRRLFDVRPKPVALLGWPRAGITPYPVLDCPWCDQWVTCPECDGAGGFDETEEVWYSETQYDILRTWYDCPKKCEDGKVFDPNHHKAGCPRSRP